MATVSLVEVSKMDNISYSSFEGITWNFYIRMNGLFTL